MKVACIYLRVITEEQDLSRQDAIVQSTKAAGFYVAGQQQAHKQQQRRTRHVAYI